MNEKRLLKGNEAFAMAAINAGCRYYFGYPITPQNEVPEYMSRELKKAGGAFVQAESEIGAINMPYGASAAGGRVLISSSSPGIALMQETIGVLSSVELPVVIIDVMRGGPGIGSIQASQADYDMLTRGGSNGDYHTIVFAPANIQEACDMIYKAFDVAEEYRNPVIICADGLIGQMMEPVILPEPKDPALLNKIENDKPWALTGHKNDRERRVINSVWLDQEELEKYIDSYWPKYERAEDKLQDWEEYMTADAETIFVAYGSTSRVVREAISELREEGIKAGMIRPKSLWPFPGKAFDRLGPGVKRLISVELSKAGQMRHDIKYTVGDKYPVSLINRWGGMLLAPDEVIERTKAILEDR